MQTIKLISVLRGLSFFFLLLSESHSLLHCGRQFTSLKQRITLCSNSSLQNPDLLSLGEGRQGCRQPPRSRPWWRRGGSRPRCQGPRWWERGGRRAWPGSSRLLSTVLGNTNMTLSIWVKCAGQLGQSFRPRLGQSLSFAWNIYLSFWSVFSIRISLASK